MQNSQQVQRAGEGPEKSEKHDFGKWTGWHKKGMPDGGEMIIYDGF